MNLGRTVVGIDPSGNRLALVAVRMGVGGPSLIAPPVVLPLRGERESAFMAEAEAALSDLVARHELAGSPARLCIPASHVYTARVVFPRLKDGDLRQALALELERLFPFPAARLRFGWRKTGNGSGDRNIRLIVAATPSDYLERWEECVSRAGLVLSGAIPAGWALSSACAKVGHAPAAPGGLTALVRNAGGAAECTVLSRGEPVFSAARACAPEAMPAEAAALLEEILPDAVVRPGDGDDVPAEILAPSEWHGEKSLHGGGDGISWRVNEGFEGNARKALFSAEDLRDPWEVLGAFGAAVGERTMDLLAPARAGGGFPWPAAIAGFFGAAALLLALAWPATVAWKAGAEMRRLDGQIASLQPAVARAQADLDEFRAIDAKVAVLRDAGADRGEPIAILRALTERLPSGTWLTGLRVENRKVEMDGFSPAASEIFPLLTRDGRFRGVEFAAPITRQGDNRERFQIRAEYVPARQSGTGEGGSR